MDPVRLTKRICDAATYQGLQTPSGAWQRCFLWDTELRGFALRVFPSGRKAFVLVYRVAGRQRLMSLGRYGVLTVQQARNRAQQALVNILDGQDPLANRQADNQGARVTDLAARYMEDHARRYKKPRSVQADQRMWDKSVLPALGSLRVHAVTAEDVRALHSKIGRAHPVKANRVLALLSKAFGLAEQWGLRPQNSNPCVHVQRYKETARERFLSEAEVRRLARAIESEEETGAIGGPAALAIRLILLTGCRKNEVLTLRWEHVDLAAGMLHLPDSKTGKKPVYLADAACELLRQAPRTDGCPWVIAGHRRGSHLVNLDKPWRRVREAADLRGVRIHDLRHTFGGEAASAGLSLHMVGRLLGHTQAATTQRYAHLAADPMRAAAQTVGGRLADAMNGTGRSRAPINGDNDA